MKKSWLSLLRNSRKSSPLVLRLILQKIPESSEQITRRHDSNHVTSVSDNDTVNILFDNDVQDIFQARIDSDLMYALGHDVRYPFGLCDLREKLKSPRFRLFRRAGWSALQRALYLRQLYVMFTAGIPIHTATELLTDNDEYRAEVRARLEEVPRDLQRGRLLSKSLQKSELFGRLVVSSVKVGEQTGRLDQVLKNLADGEENSVKLKRTLIAKLTYPLVVLLVMTLGLVILGHVMSRVIASLPGFKPEDVPLFGFINAVFQHAAFLPVCFALSLLSCGVCWKIWHTPHWRLGAERIFLSLPILGKVLTRVETNTVTGQLSLLIKAGIPLDRGIELCSDLVWTDTFRKALLQSRSEIRSGSEVGESLQALGLFPDDVLALVMAGEISGRLEASLERAASYCADQVERTIETALALLEPLLIGFLGIAIGAVLLCTFVPIFNTLQTL